MRFRSGAGEGNREQNREGRREGGIDRWRERMTNVINACVSDQFSGSSLRWFQRDHGSLQISHMGRPDYHFGDISRLQQNLRKTKKLPGFPTDMKDEHEKRDLIPSCNTRHGLSMEALIWSGRRRQRHCGNAAVAWITGDSVCLPGSLSGRQHYSHQLLSLTRGASSQDRKSVV